MRIGHGYDVHRFGPGEAVVLGGVRIAHTQGLVAHSDGDVALHALCDALLGAIAAGDIGRHFPDSEPRFKGADSRELLRACMTLVLREGYRLGKGFDMPPLMFTADEARALAIGWAMPTSPSSRSDRVSHPMSGRCAPISPPISVPACTR